MFRKFLPTSASSCSLIVKKTAYVSMFSSSALLKPTYIAFSPKTTKTKVGFEEEDVPSEVLKNPVWDKEDPEGLFEGGELGEDECMLMSESEWEFFESLQLLSEEELDLLEKDTKAAKKGDKKK